MPSITSTYTTIVPTSVPVAITYVSETIIPIPTTILITTTTHIVTSITVSTAYPFTTSSYLPTSTAITVETLLSAATTIPASSLVPLVVGGAIFALSYCYISLIAARSPQNPKLYITYFVMTVFSLIWSLSACIISSQQIYDDSLRAFWSNWWNVASDITTVLSCISCVVGLSIRGESTVGVKMWKSWFETFVTLLALVVSILGLVSSSMSAHTNALTAEGFAHWIVGMVMWVVAFLTFLAGVAIQYCH